LLLLPLDAVRDMIRVDSTNDNLIFIYKEHHFIFSGVLKNRLLTEEEVLKVLAGDPVIVKAIEYLYDQVMARNKLIGNLNEVKTEFKDLK
jgi:uncharacterized protein YunC (DUF1805 family)